MTKLAWYNNEHEGKALRKIFNRMMKRFEKLSQIEDTDVELLGRLSHTLTIIAKTKGELSKLDYLDKRQTYLSELMDQYKLHKIIPGVVEDAKQLPGQTD